MNIIKEFIVGFVLGIANIVPGVSGGTFALILGVYERLIKVLNNIGPQMIREALTLFRFANQETSFWQRLSSFLEKYDLWFAARIGSGAALAIALLSAVMKYCLKYQFEATYGFFFGLILLSTIIPARLIKSYRFFHFFPFIIGVVLTVGIAMKVNPADKEKARQPALSEQYELQEADKHDASIEPNFLNEKMAPSKRQKSVSTLSFSAYAFIFLSGVVAISAMVLPGISGSLVLLLMGQYFAIIAAISGAIRHFRTEDILFLAVFALGLALGIIIFARIIEFVFKRYHDSTVAMLVGLIAGSLYTLWPFKENEVMNFYSKEGNNIIFEADRVIHSNVNIWPESSSLLIPVFCCLIGGLIMLFFVKQPINAVMTSEETA